MKTGTGDVREGKEGLQELLEVEEWGELLIVGILHVVVDRGRDLNRPGETIDLARLERGIFYELESWKETVVRNLNFGCQRTEAVGVLSESERIEDLLRRRDAKGCN